MDVTQAASSMRGMGGERAEHNRHQTIQSRIISLPGRNVVGSFSLSWTNENSEMEHNSSVSVSVIHLFDVCTSTDIKL